MQKDLFEIKGKVAIITGGAGVLGGAMAMGLATAGVKIGILGRTAKKVEATVDKITKNGGEAIPLVASVLNQDQLTASLDKVMRTWGQLDFLLNVAGGNKAGATIGPEQNFFDLSIPDFEAVVDLNLKGTVLPTFVFGQQMAKQGSGSIINISSMTAQQPFTRVIGYSAAKAAVDNFTKWLAVEMANKFGPKIRVNAIAPGVFVGEQNRRLLFDENENLSPRGNTIISQTPMQRFGEPEELVGSVIWLCSQASTFVTGIVVPVDGGFSAFSGV